MYADYIQLWRRNKKTELRRSAIQHALGSVSSYETRLGLWERGKLTGKPKLVCENHAMPVFYRDVTAYALENRADVNNGN